MMTSYFRFRQDAFYRSRLTCPRMGSFDAFAPFINTVEFNYTMRHLATLGLRAQALALRSQWNRVYPGVTRIDFNRGAFAVEKFYSLNPSRLPQ